MPETKAAWFAEIIQNPVSNSLFQWPIDLIEIKRATEYVVCLVYRNAQYSHMKPIKELLYQPGMSKILDWRNPFIITVCKYFLTAMSMLHSNGIFITISILTTYFITPNRVRCFLNSLHI